MSTKRFDAIAELPVLRRYARSLTRSDPDAEDLVHDALVRAYERRHTFVAGGNLRSWLLAILHNTFISGRRSRMAEQRRAVKVAEISPDHVAPSQEQATHLRQVLDDFQDLPEDQRAALHLVAIEGMAYAEAAAALGVPIGTLMSRLARGRTALRRMGGHGAAPAEAEAPTAGQKPRLRVVGGSDE
ncbi:sigma-70 family RNA polymerase sigma factor [Zavarzinia sp. CC-PAN008]|uniref:sigma-70 family RNA polymerase sigma factor n=1 Tax=Zavarzinia sp. CC-PAN008 TaxID=3243332 RepID=UPI003F743ACF